MGRKTIMNQIVSPELLAKVNPQNKQLVRDYLAYLRSIDRSPKTIEQYKADLDIFMVWLVQSNDNKAFVDLRKRDIVAFQNYLIYENHNSPARVRRLKATLSSLSNYVCNILDDEYPSFRNIVHGIESPVNTPVREKTVLSNEQCQELLDKLIACKQYEKACCAALAMFGGRRKSELVQFKVGYFDDSNIVLNGAMYLTPEPIRGKGRGSKGKPTKCYTLVKPFKVYFDLWMNERKELGIESEWLFPDLADPTEHLEATTLNSWARTFSNLCGKDFYWHGLRHYFTTRLAKEGLPDDVIKTILAWSSVDMVSIYKDIDADDELAKYFSNGEIAVSETKSLFDL